MRRVCRVGPSRENQKERECFCSGIAKKEGVRLVWQKKRRTWSKSFSDAAMEVKYGDLGAIDGMIGSTAARGLVISHGLTPWKGGAGCCSTSPPLFGGWVYGGCHSPNLRPVTESAGWPLE